MPRFSCPDRKKELSEAIGWRKIPMQPALVLAGIGFR